MNEGDRELKPGSAEAIAAGCKCPVLDNARGRGYMGQEGIYVYSEGCPVHGYVFADEPAILSQPTKDRV